MPPKFQSSLIPKAPASASLPTSVPLGRGARGGRSFLGTLATAIFTISVLLALGVFGYKFYLNYRIEQMGVDLEKARETLQPEIISELTRLDARLVATKDLIFRHRVLAPLFEFLEDSTLTTVRFNTFQYTLTDKGPELLLKGEARGYAALAFQAEVFEKSGQFLDSVFSDLDLNDRGDVVFSFKTKVNPNLVSYERELERTFVPPPAPESTTPTTSATSTSESVEPST